MNKILATVRRSLLIVEIIVYGILAFLAGICSEWGWPADWGCSLDIRRFNTSGGCAIAFVVSFVLIAAGICANKRNKFKIAIQLVFPVLFYWIAYICRIYHVLSICCWGIMGIMLVLLFRLISKEDNHGIDCETKEDDGVGRTNLYSQEAKHILELANPTKNEKPPRGIVTAVYGPWGSGKTHCIKSIVNCLVNDSKQIKREHTISLNLWSYNDKDAAWAAMEDCIGEILGYGSQRGRRILHKIIPAALSFVSNDAQSVSNLIWQDRIDGGNHVKDVSKRRGHTSLLVLDDVERIKPDVFVHLLPLLKRLKQIPGLIVICEIARNELEKRADISMSSMELQGYLDKIFDYSFEMPPLLQENARSYFRNYVRETYHDTVPMLQQLADSAEWEFDTVRQIERVADTLANEDLLFFEKGGIDKHDAHLYLVVHVVRSLFFPVLQEMRETNWICSKGVRLPKPGSEDNAEIAQKFPLLYKEYWHSRLLQSILKIIDKADDTEVLQAAGRAYAYFHCLSAQDCQIAIREHLGGLSAEALLKKCFSEKLSNVDMPSLVRSLFLYLFDNAPYKQDAAHCLIALIQKDISRPEILHQRYYMHDADAFMSILASVSSMEAEHGTDVVKMNEWLTNELFPEYTFEEWEEMMATFFPICRYVWENGLDGCFDEADPDYNLMFVITLKPYLPVICECYGRRWANMVLYAQKQNKYDFFDELLMSDMPEGSFARFFEAVAAVVKSVSPRQALIALERFAARQHDGEQPYAVPYSLWENVLSKLVASCLSNMSQEERIEIVKTLVVGFRERWNDFIMYAARSDSEIEIREDQWDVRKAISTAEHWLAHKGHPMPRHW